jgi:peptide deformylase
VISFRSDAVGIAAPQVGVSLQIFVAEDRSEAMALDMLREVKGRVDFGLRVLVNPVLTILDSTTQTEFFEGMALINCSIETSRCAQLSCILQVVCLLWAIKGV